MDFCHNYRSGKKYSLRGGENDEKGLIVNAVDDLLKILDGSKANIGGGGSD
jgi:hypothetical protein